MPAICQKWTEASADTCQVESAICQKWTEADTCQVEFANICKCLTEDRVATLALIRWQNPPVVRLDDDDGLVVLAEKQLDYRYIPTGYLALVIKESTCEDATIMSLMAP